ncbi:MAG: vitamin K epoxide reductase family protein [Deltaproteobacteria bacterium]|nr:vitamin K epoxide reductase family protein [Deltaproteobacteria bacterium]
MSSRKKKGHKSKSVQQAKPSGEAAESRSGPEKGGHEAHRAGHHQHTRLEPDRTRPWPNWPILAICGVGLALTGYLTLVSWLGSEPLACGEGSSCDLVQGSRWGTLLGVTVSFWGFVLYGVIAWVTFSVKKAGAQWQVVSLLAFTGLAYAVYLSVVSLFVIEAACFYCLINLGILAALFLVALLQRPLYGAGFSWGAWWGQSAAVAAVLVLVLHLHYSGVFDAAAGPEEPMLKELAIHLDKTGAKFYGASWCGACQKQKKIFGASVERLPYVECTPQGKNGPRAPVCVQNNIKSYPTWMIGGSFHPGVLQPEELARISNFIWNKGAR